MSDDVDKTWKNIARSPREEAREIRIRLMRPIDGEETEQTPYVKLFARAKELAVDANIIQAMVDEAIASAIQTNPNIALEDNSNKVIATTVKRTLEENFGPKTLEGSRNQRRLLSQRSNSDDDPLPNF